MKSSMKNNKFVQIVLKFANIAITILNLNKCVDGELYEQKKNYLQKKNVLRWCYLINGTILCDILDTV